MANQNATPSKKMTLEGLMQCQMAGGDLETEPNYKSLGYPNWDDYVAAEYDLSDPAMVAFMASWRTFLDAKKTFNTAQMRAHVALRWMDVDGEDFN